jgi:hypothetical protein
MDMWLWWVLPARREVALGPRVLRALSVVPEARPRAFDVVEPPRQPLAPDDDAPFLDLWREEVATGGMVLWKSMRPFRGGSVSFPFRREETWEGLQGHEKAVSLCVEVRASGYADPERREGLVQFFGKVADRLGAVYASAGLENQEQPEAGGYLTAPSVLVHGVWVGIPPVRTWLQWFGQPYVSELSDLPSVVKSGRGLLLRRGEQPGLKGELPGPPIPAQLCWRIRTPEEERAYRAQAAEEHAYRARMATAVAEGKALPLRPPQRHADRVPADVLPPIGASPTRRPSLRSTERDTQQASGVAGAPPRLLWKDEDGPGWPGGGHPAREGPAWIERPDGSLEELNEGAWITRAEATRLAAEKSYAFEEV